MRHRAQIDLVRNLDYDTVLTSTTESSDTYSQTETTLLSALNLFVARMCCFSQVSWVKKPVDSATLFQDITKCDVDLRKSLYANVVRSCGTNLFQGMVERMSFDLTAFVPSTFPFFFSAKFQCCVVKSFFLL